MQEAAPIPSCGEQPERQRRWHQPTSEPGLAFHAPKPCEENSPFRPGRPRARVIRWSSDMVNLRETEPGPAAFFVVLEMNAGWFGLRQQCLHRNTGQSDGSSNVPAERISRLLTNARNQYGRSLIGQMSDGGQAVTGAAPFGGWQCSPATTLVASIPTCSISVQKNLRLHRNG